MKEIIANIPLGWQAVIAAAVLFGLDKLIEKKQVKKLVGGAMEKAGIWVSVFLRTRLGKHIEDMVERRIIRIKSILDFGLMRFIIGLRKDNEKDSAKAALLKNETANIEIANEKLPDKKKIKLSETSRL